MKVVKLPTVVVDNGLGGTVCSVNDDGLISGEVTLMQKQYKQVDGYLVEETRFARLIDDIARITMFDFTPGHVLPGDIIMKQRIDFFPGYVKLRTINGAPLQDSKGAPIWGKTYYSEDCEDKDELIVDSRSE